MNVVTEKIMAISTRDTIIADAVDSLYDVVRSMDNEQD